MKACVFLAIFLLVTTAEGQMRSGRSPSRGQEVFRGVNRDSGRLLECGIRSGIVSSTKPIDCSTGSVSIHIRTIRTRTIPNQVIRRRINHRTTRRSAA